VSPRFTKYKKLAFLFMWREKNETRLSFRPDKLKFLANFFHLPLGDETMKLGETHLADIFVAAPCGGVKVGREGLSCLAAGSAAWLAVLP
jgi:hypothetical protein